MKINVTRSSMPPFDEFVEEVKELWETHWLTNMGEKHQQLQQELQEFLKVKNVSLYTNGHLALEAIWEALDFPKGSEVITTPFTFVSTTHAIVRNGLVPVFCDINDKDYTIDVSKIENLITEKTVAICPVHVYGNICNTDEIERIAKKHNLIVVYDAAHAFGVSVNGKSVSNFGDFSMFSFHATKVFNTIEGGAICFNEDKYITVFNDLKNFGIHGPESTEYIGGNAKMNEFQAAMGICNLRHVYDEISKRRFVVERYRNRLSNKKGIILCEPQVGVNSNYAYFPVVFDGYKKTRDEIYELLKNENIYSRKYFFPLVNEMECYANSNLVVHGNTPIAKRISDCVLTLPLYADLPLETVDMICNIIIDCK